MKSAPRSPNGAAGPPRSPNGAAGPAPKPRKASRRRLAASAGSPAAVLAVPRGAGLARAGRVGRAGRPQAWAPAGAGGQGVDGRGRVGRREKWLYFSYTPPPVKFSPVLPM